YAVLELTAFSYFYKSIMLEKISRIFEVFEFQHFKKINSFLSIGHENFGIYFMSLRNFLTNKKLFNLKFEPNYLPIPIFVNADYLNNQRKIEFTNRTLKTINVCWISRLDKDKIKILILVLNDVLTYNRDAENKIVLHVIGNGEDLSKLEGFKERLGRNLIMPGVIQGRSLSDYLQKENIDFGISMGTSALEFSSRRIPVLLAPSTTEYSFFKNRQKKYLWLFDCFGFDLAVERFHVSNKLYSIDEVNESMERIHEFGRRCFDYTVQNHDFESIYDKFKVGVFRSTFTYTNFLSSGLLKAGRFQRILFSVKRLFKRIVS
ncbi:hypothetical protein, partial [Arachidicoccus sp.]|uniref:hypothetical protein n=1 Tax=Arachidicoccus sp. TaxID=1872624 RepID=UPI003D202435